MAAVAADGGAGIATSANEAGKTKALRNIVASQGIVRFMAVSVMCMKTGKNKETGGCRG
jgi:hypothetical protein